MTVADHQPVTMLIDVLGNPKVLIIAPQCAKRRCISEFASTRARADA
jgi:hypothetical protein